MSAAKSTWFTRDRAIWTAIVLLVVGAGVVRFWPTPPPVEAAREVEEPTSATNPPPPATPESPTSLGAAPSVAPAPTAPTVPVPPAFSSAPSAPTEGAEEGQTPQWKLGKTRRMHVVVEERAKRVDAEVRELEANGDAAGAAEKRILLARLREQLAQMDREADDYARSSGAADAH